MSATPAATAATAGTAGTAPAGDDARIGLLRVGKGIVVFVYVVVLVNLVLLALGFVLQLFGASTDAEFTRWVYRNVERIMEPFRGMFPSRALSDQSVLDASLLFAMVVYTLVGLALHALIAWLTDRIVSLRRRHQVARPSDRAGGPVSPPLGPPAASSPRPAAAGDLLSASPPNEWRS